MSVTVELVSTLSEFQAVLKNNVRVCVDFTAEWCGPCKMIGPKFVEISREYVTIKFVKVMIQQCIIMAIINYEFNADITQNDCSRAVIVNYSA